MSKKGMQILNKRNLLPNPREVDLDFCKLCVYRKQKSQISQESGRKRRVKG
jgi:hypothetical protein